MHSPRAASYQGDSKKTIWDASEMLCGQQYLLSSPVQCLLQFQLYQLLHCSWQFLRTLRRLHILRRRALCWFGPIDYLVLSFHPRFVELLRLLQFLHLLRPCPFVPNWSIAGNIERDIRGTDYGRWSIHSCHLLDLLRSFIFAWRIVGRSGSR